MSDRPSSDRTPQAGKVFLVPWVQTSSFSFRDGVGGEWATMEWQTTNFVKKNVLKPWMLCTSVAKPQGQTLFQIIYGLYNRIQSKHKTQGLLKLCWGIDDWLFLAALILILWISYICSFSVYALFKTKTHMWFLYFNVSSNECVEHLSNRECAMV